MVRCATDDSFLNWKKSFYTQITCSPHTNHVRPYLRSDPSSDTPKVIVIDLGSTNIRAGLLGGARKYGVCHAMHLQYIRNVSLLIKLLFWSYILLMHVARNKECNSF